MPNKRSKRNKIHKYYCDICHERLWRLGGTKYHLFYRNAAEIKQNTGISAKKAKLLAIHKSTYLDINRWIEAFCCSNHGMVWLLVSRTDEGKMEYRQATAEDWLQTNNTIDPRMSNPSVSEFSQRMSRTPHYRY